MGHILLNAVPVEEDSYHVYKDFKRIVEDRKKIFKFLLDSVKIFDCLSAVANSAIDSLCRIVEL